MQKLNLIKFPAARLSFMRRELSHAGHTHSPGPINAEEPL